MVVLVLRRRLVHSLHRVVVVVEQLAVVQVAVVTELVLVGEAVTLVVTPQWKAIAVVLVLELLLVAHVPEAVAVAVVQ
jgi:hypothetical protein